MENNQIEIPVQELVDSINMYPVQSSNIVAMGYNETNRVLRVIFRGNSSYLYFNVEPEVWQLLMNSESKGRALNESIVRQKEKYKYVKLKQLTESKEE